MEVGRPSVRKSAMEDHSRYDFGLSKIRNDISFSLFCFVIEHISALTLVFRSFLLLYIQTVNQHLAMEPMLY